MVWCGILDTRTDFRTRARTYVYVYRYSSATSNPVWSCQPHVSMPQIHPRSARAQTGVSFGEPLVRVVFTFARTFLVASIAPGQQGASC